MNIAAISDIHFGEQGSHAWCYEAAPFLLEQAVDQINSQLQPDVTVILGDLIQDPDAEDASDRMHKLFGILAKLRGPWFAIRGNHDVPAELFHSVFPCPPDPFDVADGRLVAFPWDPDEPDFMSSRTPEEIARFAAARAGFDGPIVAMQHVPVIPPDSGLATFNYVNAEKILHAMDRSQVVLSLSGHWHEGFPMTASGATNLCSIPPFCEPPHRFLGIRLSLAEPPVVTTLATD